MTTTQRWLLLFAALAFTGTNLPALTGSNTVIAVADAAPTTTASRVDAAIQASPDSQAVDSNAETEATSPTPKKRNWLAWFSRNRTPEQLAEIEEQKRQREAELDDRELEHERRAGQLQQEERHLLAHREQRPLFRLRDVVNAIDRDNRDAKKDLEKLYASMNDLRGELAKDKAQLADKQPRHELDAESEAELTETVDNLNQEITLQRLKADRLEGVVDLRGEASRIDKDIGAMVADLRPTLHRLVEKRAAVAGEAKRNTDCRLTMERATQLRDEIAPALSLLQNKLGVIVQHIPLLESKYDLTRDRALRTEIAVAKIRRRLIEKRVETLQAQIAAIDDGLAVYGQMRELYNAELAVLRADFDDLLTRYAQRVLVPLAAIVLVALLHLTISRGILPRIYHRDRLFVARRVERYLAVMAVLLVLVSFFAEDLRPFATALGIAGAALVIALQDLFSSLAGWFVIVSGGKLRVGDRIEVDGKRGDVLDIQLLRTTLLELGSWLEVDEPTGRVVVMPNSFVFKEKVMNFTHVHPYIWNKIDITVTFETPAREAEALLRRILEEETCEEFKAAREGAVLMEHAYGVPDTVYEPKMYSLIADSGILFRLLYVAHYRRLSSTRTRINARIIAEFDADKRMQLAYPTRREICT